MCEATQTKDLLFDPNQVNKNILTCGLQMVLVAFLDQFYLNISYLWMSILGFGLGKAELWFLSHFHLLILKPSVLNVQQKQRSRSCCSNCWGCWSIFSADDGVCPVISFQVTYLGPWTEINYWVGFFFFNFIVFLCLRVICFKVQCVRFRWNGSIGGNFIYNNPSDDLILYFYIGSRSSFYQIWLGNLKIFWKLSIFLIILTLAQLRIFYFHLQWYYMLTRLPSRNSSISKM